MDWQNPTHFWTLILPLFLLVGWIISEFVRLHRLKVFGDPCVLGVSVRWVPRIAALVLLMAGVGFAAALIPMPVGDQTNSAADTPIIQLLIDVHSLEGAEEQTWEAFESAIQALVGQFPGAHFSATALGSPSTVLVYPTADRQGLQIILSRLRYESPSGDKSKLAQELSEYVKPRGGPSQTVPLIVVTAMPADELERAAATVSSRQPELLFTRFTGGSEIQYGHRNPAGDWAWTAGTGDWPQFFAADAAGTERKAYLRPAQWFALLAVIFLCAEHLCSLSAYSRTGRMHVA